MMRYILVGILALMVFAVGLLTFEWYRGQNQTVAFGAPFELVDHNGEPITEQAFRGTPSAVFFGFTHCPEVCPTTARTSAPTSSPSIPSATRRRP
jgi:protein SCO1